MNVLSTAEWMAHAAAKQRLQHAAMPMGRGAAAGVNLTRFLTGLRFARRRCCFLFLVVCLLGQGAGPRWREYANTVRQMASAALECMKFKFCTYP